MNTHQTIPEPLRRDVLASLETQRGCRCQARRFRHYGLPSYARLFDEIAAFEAKRTDATIARELGDDDGKIDGPELIRIIHRAQEVKAVTSGVIVSACREAKGKTAGEPVYTNQKEGA